MNKGKILIYTNFWLLWGPSIIFAWIFQLACDPCKPLWSLPEKWNWAFLIPSLQITNTLYITDVCPSPRRDGSSPSIRHHQGAPPPPLQQSLPGPHRLFTAAGIFQYGCRQMFHPQTPEVVPAASELLQRERSESRPELGEPLCLFRPRFLYECVCWGRFWWLELRIGDSECLLLLPWRVPSLAGKRSA